MDENFRIIVFAQISPSILVPSEWPVCKIHRIVLDLAKDIILQNNYEDSVLQVNGIPARIHRYVDQHGFFYVFKKILSRDMHGSFVYDITFFEDINNNKMENSSGTSYERSRRSDNCSCSDNYTISCYRVPSCIIKRKALNMSANESKVNRMYQRILDESVSHD